ncbi:hypothetical protein LSPH24S_06706 [Lysinibacillus sphaericus]
MEILLGRVIWSFVFTVLVVSIVGMRKDLIADLKYLWTHQKSFWQLACASFVISMNWYLYIWAVTHEHLIETSLGYYINPLLSVIFGVVFFKESLSRAQWVATAIAFIRGHHINGKLWNSALGWQFLLRYHLLFTGY